MKSTGHPEPEATRGAREHVRLWTARFPSWGPRRTGTADTRAGAEGRTQGDDSRLWRRDVVPARPTPSSAQTRPDSPLQPIRSPARAVTSQGWFLKGEAAGSSRYTVRKVSPGASSHRCVPAASVQQMLAALRGLFLL